MSIKAGDLVAVTKPSECCQSDRDVGRIFKVQEVSVEYVRCKYCKHPWPLRRYATHSENKGIFVSRLTRIDPLPESETQDNNESLTA